MRNFLVLLLILFSSFSFANKVEGSNELKNTESLYIACWGHYTYQVYNEFTNSYQTTTTIVYLGEVEGPFASTTCQNRVNFHWSIYIAPFLAP